MQEYPYISRGCVFSDSDKVGKSVTMRKQRVF